MLPNWQEIVIDMATFGMSGAYNPALAIPCMQVEAQEPSAKLLAFIYLFLSF